MRLTAFLILLAGASSLCSQTCGPSRSVLRTLDELQIPGDMRLSAAERTVRKIELLRKALKASPNDVFLHEEYQRIRIRGMEADRPPVIEEYEKLLAQHPDDPAYLYLAASAQLGRDTTQSIVRLEHAIDRSPSFGLPHLLLAQVYSASSHEDPTKVKRHLEAFESACPESVRAFPALRWSKDTALVAQAAASIRRNLKSRTDSEALEAYSILWAFEAAQHRSDEQAESITRLKQDVARLLAPDVPRNAAWLSTIESVSYIQDGVDEYPATASREIAARYPNSAAAVTEARLKARDPNPYPNNGTPEQIAAYWRKEWQSALPIARQFPGSLSIAGTAARSIVRDPSATGAEIHGAIVLFLAAAKADQDGMRTRPPQAIEIAQMLAKRGIVEDIPDLVFAGFSAVERGFSPSHANDVFGGAAGGLRQQRDQMNLWGYNALSEAYTRLGRQYKPKDLATKTALVTLWASWCGPCRAELPYFEKLQRQFQGRDDIVFLAFNIDDDIADMNKALAELKLSIPSVYAAPFVYSMLSEMAIPANWLLTPAKTELVYVDEGSLPEWQAKMAQALEKAAAR